MNYKLAIVSQLLNNIFSLTLLLLGMFILELNYYLEVQLILSVIAFAGFMHLGSIDGLEYRYIVENEEKIKNDNIICHVILITIIMLILCYYKNDIIGIVSGYLIVLSSLLVAKYKYLGFYYKVSVATIIEKVIGIIILLVTALLFEEYIKIIFFLPCIALILLIYFGRGFLININKMAYISLLDLKNDIKLGFPILIGNICYAGLITGQLLLNENKLSAEELNALGYGVLISNFIAGLYIQFANVLIGKLKKSDGSYIDYVYMMLTGVVLVALIKFSVWVIESNFQYLLKNENALVYIDYFLVIAFIEMLNIGIILPNLRFRKKYKTLVFVPTIIFLMYIVIEKMNVFESIYLLISLVILRTVFYLIVGGGGKRNFDLYNYS